MSSLCWVFASANHGVHAAKSWRIKSGTPKISLGINVDICQFVNTAAAFIFSWSWCHRWVIWHWEMTWDTVWGDQICPCAFPHTKSQTAGKGSSCKQWARQVLALGRRGWQSWWCFPRWPVGFLPKGLMFSTINSWEMLLSNVPHQEVNGAFIALCPPLLSVLGNPRCWPKYSYFCILP